MTVSVVRPRKAAPDKIVLTRAVPSLPPVTETMYENSSILYLKPEILDHDHVQQVEAKLKAMPKAGNKKILLDLRDVAAGDMTEATRLANFFLKDGTIAIAGRAEGAEADVYGRCVEGDQYDGAGGGAGEPRNGWAGGAGGGGAAG